MHKGLQEAISELERFQRAKETAEAGGVYTQPAEGWAMTSAKRLADLREAEEELHKLKKSMPYDRVETNDVVSIDGRQYITFSAFTKAVAGLLRPEKATRMLFTEVAMQNPQSIRVFGNDGRWSQAVLSDDEEFTLPELTDSAGKLALPVTYAKKNSEDAVSVPVLEELTLFVPSEGTVQGRVPHVGIGKDEGTRYRAQVTLDRDEEDQAYLEGPIVSGVWTLAFEGAKACWNQTIREWGTLYE